MSLRLSFLCAMLSAAPLWVFAQHEVDDSAEQAPIKINGNENAFGYSRQAMMAIMNELSDINRYARDESMALLEALAEREGVPTDHVLMTAGSGPILMMAGIAYAEEGKNMVTVTPGYLQLTRTFKAHGGSIKEVPLTDDLVHDLDAMLAAIDENTALVYICNPNNPTGTVVDPEALKSFIAEVPESVLVFVDEAYLELAEGGLEKHTMRDLVGEYSNVLVCRTFSKVFGMAGLRIGYGVAQPPILEKIRAYHMGGPNKLGCVAAVAALEDTEFMEFSIDQYQSVRKMVTDRLDELGLEYADPQGSFVFMKTGLPISEFQKAMEERNVLVGRPFPPMLDWARISIGTEEEMQSFLSVMESVLEDYGVLTAAN